MTQANPELTNRIQTHIDKLSTIGNLGPRLEDGFLRAAWSDEETAAIRYFIELAETAGLQYQFDKVGNAFIRTPGKHSRTLQLGSHLDTVPKGGTFDGAAGIVAGFEAMLLLWNEGLPDGAGLELVIWRGEESACFGAIYAGSKAGFGQSEPETLGNMFQGRTLEEAIRSQGFDPEPIRQRQGTISAEDIDRIAAHVELHIEQANLLELQELDIGIITSIRAPRRFRVEVRGESAHSGATPMGLPFRRDANLSIAHMLVRLHELLQREQYRDAELVQTVGVINANQDYNKTTPEVYQNALTKVSGFGYFYLDIRGNKKAPLDSYVDDAKKLLAATAEEFGTAVSFHMLGESDPVESLDPHIQEMLEEACKQNGFPHIRMPSGAGHDAAIVAQQQKSDGTPVPVGMVFIPCRKGISHNPLEYTTAEAIAKGAQVIADAYRMMLSESR